LIEFGIAWILAGLANDRHQSLEDGGVRWQQTLPGSDDNSHHTFARKRDKPSLRGCCIPLHFAQLTFHKMIVLSDLLRGIPTLNLSETCHQDTFGERADICLVEAAQ